MAEPPPNRGKSNKAIERAAGISGAIVAAPWVFQGVLHIVDWIGRAQTTMALVPYLGVLTSPLAFMVEFIGGVGLLFYATRLEHRRESEEAPRIILAWAEPEKPKRHWVWLKVALASGTLSLVAALSLFFVLRHSPHQTALANNTERDLESKPKADNGG